MAQTITLKNTVTNACTAARSAASVSVSVGSAQYTVLVTLMYYTASGGSQCKSIGLTSYTFNQVAVSVGSNVVVEIWMGTATNTLAPGSSIAITYNSSVQDVICVDVFAGVCNVVAGPYTGSGGVAGNTQLTGINIAAAGYLEYGGCFVYAASSAQTCADSGTLGTPTGQTIDSGAISSYYMDGNRAYLIESSAGTDQITWSWSGGYNMWAACAIVLQPFAYTYVTRNSSVTTSVRSTATLSITQPATGTTLIIEFCYYATGSPPNGSLISSISCTNYTFSQCGIETIVSGSDLFVTEIWMGINTSSPGASVVVNYTQNVADAFEVFQFTGIGSVVAGPLVNSISGTSSSSFGLTVSGISYSPNQVAIGACGCFQTTTLVGSPSFSPITGFYGTFSCGGDEVSPYYVEGQGWYQFTQLSQSAASFSCESSGGSGTTYYYGAVVLILGPPIVTRSQNLSDTYSVADSIKKAGNRARSDPFTVTESFAKAHGHVPAALAEVFSVAENFANTHVRRPGALSDPFSLIETFFAALSRLRSDAYSLVESLATGHFHQPSAMSEAFAIAESVSKLYIPHPKADAYTVSEAVTTNHGHVPASLVDTIGFVDSGALSAIGRFPLDLIVPVESFGAAHSYLPASFADDIFVLDRGIAGGTNRALADMVALTDLGSSTERGIALALSEGAIALSDLINVLRTAFAIGALVGTSEIAVVAVVTLGGVTYIVVTGNLPNGSRTQVAAIRVAVAAGETEGWNGATANPFLAGLASAGGLSTLAARPTRRRTVSVIAPGEETMAASGVAIRRVSGALTGGSTAALNPFLHDTSVLAGANLAQANTSIRFVGFAAAENESTLAGAALRAAIATAAIEGAAALSADPTTHAAGLAPGQSAVTAIASRIGWVLGTAAGRNVAYGFLSQTVTNVLTGHTDLLAKAIQIFAMWGYIQNRSSAQATGSYSLRDMIGLIAGSSTATGVLSRFQVAAGTARGSSAAGANPNAIPTSALIGDNTSMISSAAIWTPNGECGSDGSDAVEASIACLFAGQAFEQHFNVLAGSPMARQTIAAACRSYNVARAAPVARTCIVAGLAAGSSRMSYSGQPVVADPIYLTGITDVTGYLCGPVRAAGTIWCKSFGSTKGWRSKPIAGALAGKSQALATAA